MTFSVLAPLPSAAAAQTAAANAENHGADGFWSTQGESVDALTALTVAGMNTSSIDLGTAVVPIQGRHPMVMAQQALTVNEHLCGRLILGLGVSHRPFIESTWGLSYVGIVGQMENYLRVLLPLLDGHEVDHDGPHWTMRGGLSTVGDRPRVYLSALGPRLAELAGQCADGVITWFVGPRSLADITVPAIERGALAGQRERPDLVSGFPICVTSDQTSARHLAAKQYGGLAALPTYQATLAREGVDGPEDVAIIGSAAEVTERLASLEDLGVTNVMVDLFGTPDEKAATLEVLASTAPVIDVRDPITPDLQTSEPTQQRRQPAQATRESGNIEP